eukprot:14731365-Alexandrium_andersonii.AAC.1
MCSSAPEPSPQLKASWRAVWMLPRSSSCISFDIRGSDESLGRENQKQGRCEDSCMGRQAGSGEGR